MEKKTAIIVYHKEDNDGIFSAALAWWHLLWQCKISVDNVDLYGVDYATLNNDWSTGNMKTWKDKYEHVIMVDISSNISAAMKWLCTEFGSGFVWIDHHGAVIKQSIIDKFDTANGIRDTHRSAILNTWKYFYDPLDIMYNDHKEPELLRILSAWDSFTYEQEGYSLDYVKRVNVGINYKCELDVNKAFDVIDAIILLAHQEIKVMKLANTDIIEKAYEIGDVICNNEKITYANILKNYGDTSWTLQDGDITRKVCVLFIQGATNSGMFETVKDQVEHGAVFKRLKDGSWCMSLYNTNIEDKFNCGDYLKRKYKGGGHIGAAGCTLTAAQFRKCLKNHTI